MRGSFCRLLKFATMIAWIGVIGSYLTYDYFVSAVGLREPPCALGASSILWRSTRFCATHSQVLIDDMQTYVINLDRHVNRNVPIESFGQEGATIQ